MQFKRVVGTTRVVNASSIGMPYQGIPGAYWLLLGIELELRRTTYDVAAAAERIQASVFPGAEDFARENVLSPPPAAEVTAIFERMAKDRAK